MSTMGNEDLLQYLFHQSNPSVNEIVMTFGLLSDHDFQRRLIFHYLEMVQLLCPYFSRIIEAIHGQNRSADELRLIVIRTYTQGLMFTLSEITKILESIHDHELRHSAKLILKTKTQPQGGQSSPSTPGGTASPLNSPSEGMGSEGGRIPPWSLGNCVPQPQETTMELVSRMIEHPKSPTSRSVSPLRHDLKI